MNLQLLPPGASFYQKLKDSATANPQARKRLAALHTALSRFGMRDQPDMAEALLRMDAYYGRRSKPRPGDAGARKLFEMHDFYLNLL
jgi:hypothetical protein